MHGKSRSLSSQSISTALFSLSEMLRDITASVTDITDGTEVLEKSLSAGLTLSLRMSNVNQGVVGAARNTCRGLPLPLLFAAPCNTCIGLVLVDR